MFQCHCLRARRVLLNMNAAWISIEGYVDAALYRLFSAYKLVIEPYYIEVTTSVGDSPQVFFLRWFLWEKRPHASQPAAYPSKSYRINPMPTGHNIQIRVLPWIYHLIHRLGP